MKKDCFIINPASRGGRSKKNLKSLLLWLNQTNHPATVLWTTHQGHASQIAKVAAEDGYRKIFAVGGDGTLSEVVNGLMQVESARRPSVGIISSGTGGDFARLLSQEHRVGTGFSWIKNTQTRYVDVGKVKLSFNDGPHFDRYFINIADVGLSGEVTRKVNASKRYLGKLEYLSAALKSCVSYHPPRVKITGIQKLQNKKTPYFDLLSLIVANGQYFGGGMCIAPHAKIDDGQFEILLIEKVSYLSYLKQLPRLYLKRKMSHPNVHYVSGDAIKIEALEGSLPVDIDGEFFSADQLAFTLIPKALQVLVPHKLTGKGPYV